MCRVQKARYCFRSLVEIFDLTSCRTAELLQLPQSIIHVGTQENYAGQQALHPVPRIDKER
jgi:hypothetical protein